MPENIEMLTVVANGLGEMKNEVVFVGGSVAELYANDPAASDIFIFSAPYYLGAKFEAMLSRGGNDLRISHDFEDIVYILDNTTDSMAQISKTDEPLKSYLTNRFMILLANSNIEEAIECVLPYGADERVKYILEILGHDYSRL